MNRKEGYYWVKYSGRWFIARYLPIIKLWHLPIWKPLGLVDVTESDLDEINETQIPPPNN
jgi:hypothetical protein